MSTWQKLPSPERTWPNAFSSLTATLIRSHSAMCMHWPSLIAMALRPSATRCGCASWPGWACRCCRGTTLAAGHATRSRTALAEGALAEGSRLVRAPATVVSAGARLDAREIEAVARTGPAAGFGVRPCGREEGVSTEAAEGPLRAHPSWRWGCLASSFRWFYRRYSLKSVKRNILRFVGFAPVRSIVISNV